MEKTGRKCSQLDCDLRPYEQLCYASRIVLGPASLVMRARMTQIEIQENIRGFLGWRSLTMHRLLDFANPKASHIFPVFGSCARA